MTIRSKKAQKSSTPSQTAGNKEATENEIRGVHYWTDKRNQPLRTGFDTWPAQELADDLRYRFSCLAKIAEGRTGDNDDAVIEILRLLEELTEDFENLLKTDSTRFDGLINSSEKWPVLLPARNAEREKLLQELKERGLGRLSELYPLGEYRDESPITGYVNDTRRFLLKVRRTPHNIPLHERIGSIVIPVEIALQWGKENAEKIPDRLTRDNAGEWATLTKPLLKLLWGEDFHQHPDFAIYKNSAAYAKSTAGVIQDAIRKQWTRTWRSLANPEIIG